MSKSLGTGVFLDESPGSMYAGVMSQADANIPQLFIDCTYVPFSEIEGIKNSLKSNTVNPRDIKMDLAKKIVSIYHGDKKAKAAEEAFINTFQKGEMPEDMEEVFADVGELVSEVLVNNKVLSSKGEWRRLVLGNAVHNLVTEENITDQNIKAEGEITLRLGKKKFIKIKSK